MKWRASLCLIFAGALLISFLFVRARSRATDSEVAQLEEKLQTETSREERLASFRMRAQEYLRLKDDVQRRITVINALKEKNENPAQLMAALGKVLGSARDIKVEEIMCGGRRALLHGQARSLDSLTNFRGALERSAFSCPKGETKEQEANGNGNATFDLDCSFTPPANSPTLGRSPAPKVDAARPSGS